MVILYLLKFVLCLLRVAVLLKHVVMLCGKILEHLFSTIRAVLVVELFHGLHHLV